MSNAQANPKPSEKGATPFGEDLQVQHNLTARHRAGRIWQALFLVSLIVGILALTTLIYNIVDKSFGLVAIETKVDPTMLSVAGVALEDLSQEQLVAIVQARVSRGVVRRLESERRLAERNREDLYALVMERVVQPSVVQSWSLTDIQFPLVGLVNFQDFLAHQIFPAMVLESIYHGIALLLNLFVYF